MKAGDWVLGGRGVSRLAPGLGKRHVGRLAVVVGSPPINWHSLEAWLGGARKDKPSPFQWCFFLCSPKRVLGLLGSGHEHGTASWYGSAGSFLLH